MMSSVKVSAGILLYRKAKRGQNSPLEFFLVHPGGPYWKGKDEGSWSVPKGEPDGAVDLFMVAKREFEEETSFSIDDCATGEFIQLQPVRQKSGKSVHAWAVEGNIDAEKIVSNTCLIEWPPRSGKQIEIPEIEKGEWFDEQTARLKINPAQAAFLDEVISSVARQE